MIRCSDSNGDGTPDGTGTPAVQAGKYISTCQSSAALSDLPKWQVSMNTSYTYPISGDLDGFVRGLAAFKPEARNPFSNFKTDKSTNIDLFLGVRSARPNAGLSVYAKNLLNDQPLTTIGQVSRGS